MTNEQERALLEHQVRVGETGVLVGLVLTGLSVIAGLVWVFGLFLDS